MAGQAEQQQALTAGGDDDDRLRRLGRLVSYALEQDELWKMWWFLLYIPIGLGRMQFEVRIHKGEDEKQAVAEFHDLLSKAVLRAAVLAEYALEGSRTLTSGDDEEIADRTRYAKTFIIDTYLVKDPVERLKRLIALGVVDTDAFHEIDLTVAAGEIDEDDPIDELLPWLQVPEDMPDRLDRAARAALDAYYSPLDAAA